MTLLNQLFHKEGLRWSSKTHNIPIEQYKCKGTPEDPTPEEIKCGYVVIADHFDMYNAQGIRIIGWEPTQTDMASDQWDLLDDLEIPLEELDRMIPENIKEMWKNEAKSR